mmetsp:Transcript_93536/g.273902  ORF Transcript_93536/g.273902 Transcript_93536/m.273902 type:complete len:228 (+) Transcript_93536:975-1658(+)
MKSGWARSASKSISCPSAWRASRRAGASGRPTPRRPRGWRGSAGAGSSASTRSWRESSAATPRAWRSCRPRWRSSAGAFSRPTRAGGGRRARSRARRRPPSVPRPWPGSWQAPCPDCLSRRSRRTRPARRRKPFAPGRRPPRGANFASFSASMPLPSRASSSRWAPGSQAPRRTQLALGSCRSCSRPMIRHPLPRRTLREKWPYLMTRAVRAGLRASRATASASAAS